MSGEEKAMIRAVKAAGPDDDLPRLIYADWLGENGRAVESGRARDGKAPCPHCHGAGFVSVEPGPGVWRCDSCLGTGSRLLPPDPNCEDCSGAGEFVPNPGDPEPPAPCRCRLGWRPPNLPIEDLWEESPDEERGFHQFHEFRPK